MTIRILSLDDEPQMGDLYRLILGPFDYELVCSSDSYEAWDLLHAEPFDLLMQDLMRPEMDGWVFYTKLRADEVLHDMPVMIVTAKAQSIDKALGHHIAGIDAYVTKPFGPQELVAALEFVLGKYGKPAPERLWWRPIPQRADDIAKDVDSLIKALGSRMRKKRVSAAVALGASGDARAVDPLIQTLRKHAGGDYETAKQAAYALGEIGDERAVEPLILVLRSKGSASSVRSAAVWVLAKLGRGRVVEELIDVLQGGICPAAIGALGKIGDPRAVEPLLEVLQKGEHGSNAVAWALGDIGDARAVEPLIRELSSKSEHTIWTATRSLARIGAPSVEPLLAELQDTWYPAPRKAIIEALGQTKGGRAVEPLIEALEDDYPEVRRTAAWYLGYLKDGRAVHALVATLQHELENRKQAIPLLETLWLRRENAVACTLVRALGCLGDEAAVEPLTAALQDESADVVWQAADALGKIGTARAILHLERVVKEDKRTTRYGGAVAKMAQYAIGQIETGGGRIDDQAQ
jgi:HEAT repeat protein